MTDGLRLHRAAWVAGAGCAAAAGYATLKVAWALGSTVGLSDPGRLRADGAGLTPVARFLAFGGTAVLAAVAAAILLALVRPWGRRVPRRLLRSLAAAGSLLALPGAAGVLTTLAHLAGLRPLSPDRLGGIHPAAFLFVYGCFLVLGAALGTTAWLTRRRA